MFPKEKYEEVIHIKNCFCPNCYQKSLGIIHCPICQEGMETCIKCKYTNDEGNLECHSFPNLKHKSLESSHTNMIYCKKCKTYFTWYEFKRLHEEAIKAIVAQWQSACPPSR